MVESCGRLCVGNVEKDHHFRMTNGYKLRWRSVVLPLTPICCSSMQNFLFLSDGYSSYLYEIQTDDSLVLEDKLERLSLCGIVKMRASSTQICFETYDGRSYTKSLQALQEDAKKESSQSVVQSLYVPDLNLEDAMKAIKRYSEIIKTEKENLEKVNIFLEQINIAQTLLSDIPKELFSIKLSILPTTFDECYVIVIYLRRLNTEFKFQGTWWRLNVVLKDCSLSCNFTDFDNSSDTSQVSLLVPFHILEKLILNCSETVYIEFYLMFLHFSLEKPLCVLKIHQEPLDILYFLTPIRNSDLPPLFTSNFITKVTEIFQNSKVHSLYSKKHSSLSYYKSFLIVREKHFSILEKLFNEMPSVESVSITRWVQNIPVNLCCEKAKDMSYKITLESISRDVVVAIKCSIEQRIMKNYNVDPEVDKTTVEIPSTLYSKAHVTKVVLNLETSPTNLSSNALEKMYDSVADLISDTPL